jgi:hypothetical protein
MDGYGKSKRLSLFFLMHWIWRLEGLYIDSKKKKSEEQDQNIRWLNDMIWWWRKSAKRFLTSKFIQWKERESERETATFDVKDVIHKMTRSIFSSISFFFSLYISYLIFIQASNQCQKSSEKKKMEKRATSVVMMWW